ncbi:MAG: hypothetical protein KJ052_21785 [Candidatus Hydrogenedentes bacterium]|nr:hypothetical protein [Candidatus Hydrogenedentota bacterium]
MPRYAPYFFAAFAILTIASFPALAEFTVEKTETPAPEGVSEAVAGALDDKMLKISKDGSLVYEIWLAKRFPVKNASASLNALKTAGLIGVMKIHEEQRDFRDDVLPAGVYTLRFAEQPVDGDHLGTAPTETFAILSKAGLDTDPAPLDSERTLFELSMTDNPAAHPLNMSLQPVTEAGDTPRIDEKDDWPVLVVSQSAATGDGSDAGELAFALVIEGHGEI